MLYAYASSQLMYLRFRRALPNSKPLAKLHDPPALEAEPGSSFTHLKTPFIIVTSFIVVLSRLVTGCGQFPGRGIGYYSFICPIRQCACGVWDIRSLEWRNCPWCVRRKSCISSLAENDRFTGDKSNHVPVFHVPQLYYFVGFASLLGWPVLVSGKGGISGLAREILQRMFGRRR